MFKFLCVALLSLIITTATAQEGGAVIKGRVLDSVAAYPVDYATITLFANGAKKPLDGTTTDSTGSFILKGVAAGVYKIVLEFIGYKPVTINNVTIAKKNDVIDLKNVLIVKFEQKLKDVVVTTQSGLIENKIDKMVFNVEKDLTSQGGVATDALKKVPQVSVDIDGNVELAGSSSIQFLINGKPSTAFGSSIADVLQSIPASQIKSIEVITNPGAKYDAQGLGGIINIILKQSKVKGINGNISLTAGTRQENGSINFTARKGNFGVHGFASGNARLYATTPSTSNRLSYDSIAKNNAQLLQNGSSRFTRHGVESGAGFDWSINKKNTISGSIGYDDFGNMGSGIINQSQTATLPGSGSVISDILSRNFADNSFHFQNVDASLDYKRTFDKEDQELDISINSSFGHNNIIANNNQFYQPQDSLYYGINNHNPGTENETQAQVDYVQPLKKGINLGVGGKLSARDIRSTTDVLSFQPSSKSFQPDTYLSNYLTYHEKVYAFYSEISFPVGQFFEAKVGGRYERTELNAYFSNAQQQVATPGYNTVVPSIYFLRKLPNDQTIKISYSKRIERPDYRVLNPFFNTSDPKNITSGNPYLQPEIGNRYELSYNKNLNKLGSFMVSVAYRTSNHDIQPYIVYHDSLQVGDTVYHNVSVSTSQNIGLEQDLGVNLFGDLHFTQKFSIRSNIFFFHRHTINAINPGLNSTSFNYRMNINASYQFNSNFAAEFFGNFSSARHEVQGRYPSFTSYSFAFRKQIWNKKGSLALTANNPFGEYVNQRVDVFGPGFSQSSVRKVPYRSIGINFTWKFGKLEFKPEHKEAGDNGGGAAPDAN